MKSIKDAFKQVRIGIIVVMFLVSLIISYVVLCGPITDAFYKRLPVYRCTLEVLAEVNEQAIPNREVWIEKLILDSSDAMEEVSETATENVGFEYREAETFGYMNDVIVNTAGEDGRLVFEWMGGEENTIVFWKQNLSGKVHFQLSRGAEIVRDEVIDLYSAESEDYQYDLDAPILIPVKWRTVQYGCVLIGGVLLLLLELYGFGKLLKGKN